MGFNQLYSDHQRLQMLADGAPAGSLKVEQQHAATLIAGQIGCMQHALGATAARGWELLAAVEAQPPEFAPPGILAGGSAAFLGGDASVPNSEICDADQIRRGREIKQLALLLLGAERATTFLESPNGFLGARPLQLAVASGEGRDRVETELGRMISHATR